MVPATVQKKDNPAEKTTSRPTYRHPNYKKHFDQRQGQNEHKQRRYDFIREITQNEQPKQKTRSAIQQSGQQTTPINIDLGWTTSQTIQQFFLGICNSYRFVSSSVTITNTKIKKMSLQTRNQM